MIRFSLLLMLCGFYLLEVQAQNPAYEQLSQKLNQHIEAKDYQQALGQILSLQALESPSAQAEQELAANLAKILPGLNFEAQADSLKNLSQRLQTWLNKSPHLGLEHRLPVLNQLSNLLNVNSLHEESLQLSRLVIEQADKAGAKFDTEKYIALQTKGTALLYQGEYEEAIETYILIMPKLRAMTDQPENYIFCLNNLAILYETIGNQAQAEPLYLEAIEFAKALNATEDLILCTTNLSDLYRQMKRYKESLRYAQAAWELCKASNIKELDYSLISGVNLMDAHMMLGDYAAAKALEGELDRYLSKGMLKDMDSEPFLYLLKAKLCFHFKEQAQGRQYVAQGMKLYEQREGSHAAEFLQFSALFAEVLLEGKELKLAEEMLLEAFRKARFTEDNQLDFSWDSLNRYEYWASAHLMNELWSQLRQIRKLQWQNRLGDGGARELSDQAYQAFVRQGLARFSDLTRSLSFNEGKLEQLRRQIPFVEAGLDLAADLGSRQDWPEPAEALYKEAFSYAEQNKAVLLAQAQQGRRAQQMANLPDSVYQREQGLSLQHDALKKALSEAQEPAERAKLREQLNGLNSETELFMRQLKTQYPQYHALRYGHVLAKAEEIQTLIPPKAFFLEYFVGDSASFVFGLSRDKISLHRLPGASLNLLRQKIKDLRRALTDFEFILREPEANYQLYSSTAYWFYQNILEPALAQAPAGTEQLIIVSDGELGHLPFEVFLTQAPAGPSPYADLPYLLKAYRLSYNYSASLWRELMQRPGQSQSNRMLAFAAAYQGAADSSGLKLRAPWQQQMRQGLSPLPQALAEVQALSQRFKGEFVLGKTASEGHFKQIAGQYGLIHLAMHGLVSRHNPQLSALAFTEQGDSLHDNFLEVWEIARLNLQAELVVLSACETGYGKFEQGEGVLSLGRAFMQAGSPAVLMSLWQINDGSTAQIMADFYTNLQNGLAKDEALRQAQLRFLSQAEDAFAHPAYWGAFVQLGDYRPLKLAQKSAWSPLVYLGLAAAALGLLGFGLYRRRQRA